MNPITDSKQVTSPERNVEDFLAQPGVREKVNSIAKRLGVMPEELLYAIGKETAGSYSSAQRNLGGGKAVGLIQFYPDYNKELGKSETFKTIRGKKYEITDLEKMTELQQLDVVEEYLIENFKGRGGKPGELYVSIGYPGLVGKSPDTKITGEDLARIKIENPGWVDENDNVTKAQLMSFGGSKPEFAQFNPDDAPDGREQTAPTAEDAASMKAYTGNNPRLLEAQKFLDDYVKIEKSELTESSKIKAIADLFKTSPGAKYAIPNYVQGVARTPVGNTGMADIDIEKLGEGVIDTDPAYLLGIDLERGDPTLKRLVNKIRRDLNKQGASDILNRAYKTDQMFQGVPASKLFDKIPEYSNQEGADMSLNPTKLDPLIIAKQTPLVLDERLLQEEPIKLDSIKPGQIKQPEEIKLFEELDVKEPEEKEEKVDIELSRRKQKKAIREAQTTGEKNKLAQFLSDNKDKINNTLNASIGLLTAAAGAKSIMQAIEKDNVAKSHVDPLFTEALQKIRAASEQGMPYEQRQAAMKDINSAYTGAMKNVMAISGGQRGMALANIGAVDANRLNSLVDLAAKDSDIRQKNLALFAQTAGQYSQQKLTADMSFEKLKSTLDMNRKNRLATIGSGLLEQAFQMKTDYTAAKTASKLIPKAGGSDADRVNAATNPIYLQGFEQELDDGFQNTLTIDNE